MIGTGVVRLCFARAASLTGSSLVVILGRRAEPLEPAVQLRADAVINASEDDADARANQLTDRRGFDYVIEAVGENNLINLSLRLVARGPWSSCHPGKKSEGDVEGAIDNSGRRGNDAGQTSCSDSSGRRTAHRLQLHEA